jgi:flagellar biosynthesis/type III secretory pathway M-ring protein FliF/YscJ
VIPRHKWWQFRHPFWQWLLWAAAWSVLLVVVFIFIASSIYSLLKILQ